MGEITQEYLRRIDKLIEINRSGQLTTNKSLIEAMDYSLLATRQAQENMYRNILVRKYYYLKGIVVTKRITKIEGYEYYTHILFNEVGWDILSWVEAH